MSFCDEISVNCDECLEIDTPQCADINILTDNLTPDTDYFLHIIDKFQNQYTAPITVNGNKSFDIKPSDFDKKIFVSSNGKLEAFLSTSESGQTYNVTITVDEVDYKCIIISISNE